MLKPMKKNKVLALVANAFLIVWGGTLMAASPLDASVTIEKAMNKDSVKTQKRVDQLADQTSDMAQTYQLTLQSIDSLKAYNSSLNCYNALWETHLSIFCYIICFCNCTVFGIRYCQLIISRT